MKDIFYKILFTFTLLLFLLTGLSRLYDFALLQNCNLKASYVQKAKINAQLLFHGPCEPLWMISPEQITRQTGLSCYNLALSHSDFADNYLHLYFYLKNNAPPRFMFLYVTPESMDLKYNTFNSYRFAAFLTDSTVSRVVNDCDSAYYRWSAVPFMNYAYYSRNINFDVLQGLKHYFTHRTLPYFADGYEPPIQIKWDNHLEEFIQLYPKGYHFKWNANREKYLRKTIELAQQHHIRVYLYESPVLLEAIAYQPNRSEMIQQIKALAAGYHIEYIPFEGMKMAASRK